MCKITIFLLILPQNHFMQSIMLRKLLLMAALMVGVAAFPQKGAEAADTASAPGRYIVAGVGFYNVENLFDTINNNGKYDFEFSPQGLRAWNTEKYRIKLANLARAITSMTIPETPVGPAVIGISEVENESVVKDLVAAVDSVLAAEGRAPWNLRYVHHDSPDRRGIDVALLYNPLFFEVTGVNTHRLTFADEPDFLTRDQLVVSGSLLDKPMAFIVNHWPSRLGGQEESSPRREAAGALSRHIADSLRAAVPGIGVMMMGDLNDDPADKSCAVSFGGVRTLEELTPGGFFNPFWEILAHGVGTLCYRGEWNLFDQIMVSDNLADGSDKELFYWKSTVYNQPMLRQQDGRYKNYPWRTFSGKNFIGGFSDHFPTEVFLLRAVEE